MKKITFIAITSVLALSCKQTKVPLHVQNSFVDKVPVAQDVVWTVEDNIYQVDYYVSAKHTTSYFDEQGQWLETETEIAVDELPHDVLQTLQTKMGEYEILDIELVATREGQTLYEVDLEKDYKSYDILFDKDGKILRKKI